MDKEFLNVSEVGKYLGIKISTLYFYVENGNIPHYRVGRLIRFKKLEIDQWMQENKKQRIDLSKMTVRMLGKVSNRNSDVHSIVKKAIAETK